MSCAGKGNVMATVGDFAGLRLLIGFVFDAGRRLGVSSKGLSWLSWA